MKLNSRHVRHTILVAILAAALGLIPAVAATPQLAAAQSPATSNFCGSVSAYTPSTATATGSVTVNGTVYTIAAGSTFGGAGSTVIVGSVQCFNVTLTSGAIVSGTVTAAPPPTPTAPFNATICGTVSAYTPSSATATGSVTIAGITYTIAAGSTFGGTGSTVIVGSAQCLNVTLNASGNISTGTVTSYFGTVPAVNYCGVLTAFVPSPTQGSGFGMVTINGITFNVAVNTFLPGQTTIPTPIPAGFTACLSGVINATNGVLTSGSITAISGVPLAATPVFTGIGGGGLTPHAEFAI